MKNLLLFALCILLISALSGCAMPQTSGLIRTHAPDVTQAYSTVSAWLTRSTPAAPGSATPTLRQLTPSPTAISTGPFADASALPTPPCNRAAPGAPIDVTIPDETPLQPRQPFTKTWRLQNSGACPWTRAYALQYFSGDLMGSTRYIPFNAVVQPGQTVDLSVDMVAPDVEGVYQSNWKISSDDGQFFGLGPNGDAPFWVRVRVEPSSASSPAPEPTPTATATPMIFLTGLINLAPGTDLDLDTQKVATGANTDLAYTAVEGEPRQINPQNGARLGLFGLNAPTYLDCLATNLSTEMVAVELQPQGVFFCMRTNGGLPGWTRLVALNSLDGTLTLEMLTWAIP